MSSNNRDIPKKEEASREEQNKKNLRLYAESKISNEVRQEASSVTPSIEEFESMVHELKVHQVELEMQNIELKETQIIMSDMRAKYYDLYNTAPVGYLVVSINGEILEANNTFIKDLAHSRIFVLKSKITDFIENRDQDNYYFHTKRLSGNHLTDTCVLRLIESGGLLVWVQLKTSLVTFEDGDYYKMAITNIDNLKKNELRVDYLSKHDAMTGLYNRRYYEEKLTSLDIEENLPMTIVMGDINGLKIVNDAFGHEQGDQLIINVANLLKNACRSTDIIARTGGDEYVMLLPYTDETVAEQMIERISSAVNEINFNGMHFSISFGSAVKRFADENIHDVYLSAENTMYRHKLLKSAHIKNNMINLVMNALYEKDHHRKDHAQRVSLLCEKLATAMKLSSKDKETIISAGLMHDIGEIGISNEVLNDKVNLTNIQHYEMQRHAEIGYRILSASTDYANIAPIILCHHEKLDGTGYPNGLKGKEISVMCRILAIAEAYEGMTGQESLKQSLSKNEAIVELRAHMNTSFDAEICELFINEVLPGL